MKQITKAMLKAVDGVEPSSTLLRVKDGKLRYISDLLIDHKLVERVENERSLYIPLNYYHLIYDAISELHEYKLIINQDLNTMMITAIEDWMRDNDVDYNEKLLDSKLSKAGHVLNKIQGTTKIKHVKVDGKKAKFRFIDKRLSRYIFKMFKNNHEFKQRFM